MTHRLWVARGSTSVTFTPKAFDLVHAVSGGVPRMINLLCDRALMVGVRATNQPASPKSTSSPRPRKLGHEIPKGKIRASARRRPQSPRGVQAAPR